MATTSTSTNFNQKGYVRRALKERQSKINEPVKTAIVIKAQKTSQTIKDVLGDWSKLKSPNALKYNKKNSVRPFDDASKLEFFADKSDASLFLFGSHSNKRPNNLVVGRFFNYRMLDMVEFTVQDFKSMSSFEGPKQNLASRTCVIFQGEEFENNESFKKIANILLDFFVEQPTEFVNLACLDHVLVFTSQSNKILMRHYTIVLKKSGSRIPRIELNEIGPSMDLEIRRNRFASADLEEQANTHHVDKKSKGKKNITKDSLHQQHGTIHVGRQNLDELQIKKQKALRKHKVDEGNDDKPRKKVKKSEDN